MKEVREYENIQLNSTYDKYDYRLKRKFIIFPKHDVSVLTSHSLDLLVETYTH